MHFFVGTFTLCILRFLKLKRVYFNEEICIHERNNHPVKIVKEQMREKHMGG